MEAKELFEAATPGALLHTRTNTKHRRWKHKRSRDVAKGTTDVECEYGTVISDDISAWHKHAKTKKEKRPGPPEIAVATERETTFRHGHWKERRERIIAHLKASGTPWVQMHRFENCGAACMVQWSEKLGRRRLRASYCRNRHCEPCMRAKANLIARNLSDRLKTRPRGRYRFITLTLAHTDTPLADQLRRLVASFKKLRSTKLWKRRRAGGCFTIEVKHNGTHWHPHLHLIDEGDFIPQAALSDAWHEITGDSLIVHVQRLDNGEAAAHYVTKYVTKGVPASVWHTDDLAQEWITGSKGVRACATYGTWRGFKLTEIVNRATDWTNEMSLDDLLSSAARGDEHAKIVRALLIPLALDPEVVSQAR